jgi:hypothetical protein
MRSKTFLSIIYLLLLVFSLTALRASAQEKPSRQLVVPLPGAGFIAFKTETVADASQKIASPAFDAQALMTPQVLLDDNNVIHRVLVDKDGFFIFGYDLIIEPLIDSRQFKVSVRPLSPKFELQLRARQPNNSALARLELNVSTLPSSTTAQTIDDGDAFALDLLVNPNTGVKIIDVVKASYDRTRLWEVPARDFTLDQVELAIRDYKLVIDGTQVGGGKATRGAAGTLLWFYVHGQGRFIFSLVPRGGYDFQKTATIEDNKISFALDGKQYEWISSTPIVRQGGRWHLWMLHDPGYLPDFLPPEERTASVKADKPEQPPVPAQDASGLSEKEKKRLMNQLNIGVNGLPTKTDAKANSRAAIEPVTPPKRIYVYVGAADRIENLMPKN